MRVLALDQGTSGTKALVVDDGVVVASAEVAVRPSNLPDNRVEQDPQGLLASVLEAVVRDVPDGATAEQDPAIEAAITTEPITSLAAPIASRGVPTPAPTRRS